MSQDMLEFQEMYDELLKEKEELEEEISELKYELESAMNHIDRLEDNIRSLYFSL